LTDPAPRLFASLPARQYYGGSCSYFMISKS